MKLLVISDEEDKGLWDFYSPDKLEGIDAILSCGDLKSEYLEFLVTLSSLPVFYVHGNHDESYERVPPGGCENVDGRLVEFRGYRILGLGGCMRYHAEGQHQYTEREMRRRVRKLWFELWRKKGFDILLTHAPAQGLGDQEDLCHRGFRVFRELLDRYHPGWHLHGHTHLSYSRGLERTQRYGDTLVVNATGKYVVELPDRE